MKTWNGSFTVFPQFSDIDLSLPQNTSNIGRGSYGVETLNNMNLEASAESYLIIDCRDYRFITVRRANKRQVDRTINCLLLGPHT